MCVHGHRELTPTVHFFQTAKGDLGDRILAIMIVWMNESCEMDPGDDRIVDLGRIIRFSIQSTIWLLAFLHLTQHVRFKFRETFHVPEVTEGEDVVLLQDR